MMSTQCIKFCLVLRKLRKNLRGYFSVALGRANFVRKQNRNAQIDNDISQRSYRIDHNLKRCRCYLLLVKITDTFEIRFWSFERKETLCQTMLTSAGWVGSADICSPGDKRLRLQCSHNQLCKIINFRNLQSQIAGCHSIHYLAYQRAVYRLFIAWLHLR